MFNKIINQYHYSFYENMGQIRLQKYLAQCGIGSRRACETYIEEGRIQIDGKIVTKQGMKIDPDLQSVCFDNNIISPKPIEWIMLNKPPQYLSSAKDPSGKESFLSLLPENKRHLFAVGRLDYLSEGLLLITNEGGTANKIIHPRYEIEKEYLVCTLDELSKEQMELMRKGIVVNNERLSVKSIKNLENDRNSFFNYTIILSEGKNRHIRKMLANQQIRIRSLKRIRIGQIHLKDLSSGKWRYLTEDERKLLNDMTKSQ